MGLKRGKRWLTRAAAILLALLVLLASATAAGAYGTTLTTVRLAYGFNDFLRVDADGNATGYYAGLLKELADLNRWQYSYVQANWSEAIQLLKDGEIDFLFPTNYSAGRDDHMDFSSIPIGYTAPGIFALADSGYHYDGFEQFNGRRIVCSEGYNNLQLAAYAEKNGFTYEPVYMDSNTEMMQALRDGIADLAVFSAANEFPDGMLVSIMDAQPVYFTVREGNTELLAQLNQGMQTLLKTDPALITDVMRKTMVGSNTGVAAMTETERDFIRSGTPVRVGFYVDTEPVAYRLEDGSCDGIFVKLLEALKERSGLNIKAVPLTQDQNWRELVNAGKLDFYLGSSGVVASWDNENRMTTPFIDYANILLTRSGCDFNDLDAPVIALTPGRASWVDYLQEQLSHPAQVVYRESAKDCMLAVLSGKADATLLSTLEYTYHSKNSRFSTLIPWYQYRFPISAGLVASHLADDTMFSAVDKSIALLPADYVEAVTEECLAVPYHSYSLSDDLYNARFPLTVMGVVVAALIAVALLLAAFRRRQEKLRAQAMERERQQLELLAATSYDFSAVYYVDLDSDLSVPVSQHEGLAEQLGVTPAPARKYSDALRAFALRYAMTEYRGLILGYIDKEAVLERFKEKPHFSIRYRIRPDKRNQSYFEMNFIQVAKNSQGHDMMVLGVRCIDDIIKEEQAQQKLLQDALDGANHANAAKSEFFSRMSHDIRTPLNAIIGMTAIASARAEGPQRVREALGKIGAASRHLLSLINDVLDMSKIETGKLSLAEEEVDLPELLGSLMTLIQPQVEEHKHTLRVNTRDIRHERVIGDSLRIRQVFLNLMSNAVKYTPDGGEINITLSEEKINTISAGCYRFEVRDNGIGMSKEYQEHIFEPFSREEDPRTAKIQGTGLGMAITQNIVQMMNGSIEVESEPGKGSTFIVTIFLKFQETEADLPDVSGLSILVVDGKAEVCASICGMLEELGVRCASSTSGREAVDAVQRAREEGAPFNAVLSDWKLPGGLDGVELARAIKALPGGEAPLVVLSAYDWPDVETKAREAGVDAFLTKPLFKSGIVRLLSALMEGRTAAPDDGSILHDLTSGDFAGHRILLVEDNELNREIGTEILGMAGIEVDEAENGERAVEIFSACAPGYYDMILMDVQMPVMDGYEATRAIRALKKADAGTIPIIAMTANAFVEDIHAAKQAGMNEHLAKPIDFEKLEVLLEKYLH